MTAAWSIDAEAVLADPRFVRREVAGGSSVARAAIRGALVSLRPTPRGLLADLGSGRGSGALAFIDCSAVTRTIRVDRPGAGAEVEADLEQPLPFADDTVDSVGLFHVLEHVEAYEGLLREIARILRPGGTLVFEVPFMYPVHGSPHDFHRHTGTALRAMLDRAGFADVELAAAAGVFLAAAVPLGEVVPDRLRAGLAAAAARLDRRLARRSRSEWWTRYVVGYAGVARAR